MNLVPLQVYLFNIFHSLSTVPNSIRMPKDIELSISTSQEVLSTSYDAYIVLYHDDKQHWRLMYSQLLHDNGLLGVLILS